MTVEQPSLFTDPEPCSRCGGTGKLADPDADDGRRPCPSCLGTGERYDPETVEWPEGF
jgi:DnaJ-class molecular chaperone